MSQMSESWGNSWVYVDLSWGKVRNCLEKLAANYAMLWMNLRHLHGLFRILLLKARSRDFELGRVDECHPKQLELAEELKQTSADANQVKELDMEYRHVWSGSNTWKLRGQLSVLGPNLGKNAELPGKACNKLAHTLLWMALIYFTSFDFTGLDSQGEK